MYQNINKELMTSWWPVYIYTWHVLLYIILHALKSTVSCGVCCFQILLWLIIHAKCCLCSLFFHWKKYGFNSLHWHDMKQILHVISLIHRPHWIGSQRINVFCCSGFDFISIWNEENQDLHVILWDKTHNSHVMTEQRNAPYTRCGTIRVLLYFTFLATVCICHKL